MAGKRVRFASQDKQAALLKLRVLQTNIHNAEIKNPYRVVHTKLSDEQLHDAETALGLLGDRGITLVEATKAALEGGTFSARLNPIPFADAVKAYLADVKDRIRPRTLRARRQTLNQFDYFANNPLLSSITVEMVKKFISSRRAEDGINPIKPKTHNNLRDNLGACFNWAIEKGWLTVNPAYKGSRPARIDRGSIQILTLTRCQELMAYVSANAPLVARYFSLALFAGIRPEEIGRLAKDPRAIDLENGFIHVSQAISKTRDPRDITIQPNLRAWLLRYPDGTFNQNNDQVRQVRKETGLSKEVRDILRHTYISHHSMAFGSLTETAIESGNSEGMIRDHYFRRVSKADAQVFWSILPPV